MNFNIKMNLDNKKSGKETQIFYVIRYGGGRFKIASGKKILVSNWNPTAQKVNSKNKNAGSINAILKKRRAEIEKQLDNLIFVNKPISKESIIPFLSFGKMQKSTQTASLFRAYDLYIDSIKNHHSKNLIRNQTSAKKKYPGLLHRKKLLTFF